MLESELRIDIVNTFDSLTTHINTLCDAIMADAHLVSWMQEQERLISACSSHRDMACAIIRQVEYLDNQAPREILVSAGFMGASQRTLQLVSELNHKKNAFKQAMLSLKALKISTKDDYLLKELNVILKKRSQIATNTLQPLGLSRIHLKQCYRQIPILESAPQKISWTWAHTRSIKRITFQEAEKLLLQKGNSQSIELQRKKLYSLSPHEQLAIIQELAPHLRANIVLNIDNHIKRLMIKGPMPIFFPADSNTPYPNFKAPKLKQEKNKNRVIRNDVKIDPTPFLPAIRAHRYIRS